MSLQNVIQYSHIFKEPRPDPKDLLKNIPSRLVIGLMTLINDVLSFNNSHLVTQAYLLNNLTANFPIEIRNLVLSKAGPLLKKGYVVFELPYTIELINRELIDFRNEEHEATNTSENEELNIFKAYLAVLDEMIQKDIDQQADAITKASELGGEYLLKLLWPSLIKQYEFLNSSDVLFERYKGRAFISYLESHQTFKQYAESYYQSLNCKSGQHYLSDIESMIVINLKRLEMGPPDHFSDHLIQILPKNLEPVLESLTVDPDEIKQDLEKQIDYRGLKEKPLFKFDKEKNAYIVPHWNYLYNTIFSGVVFSFFKNSGLNLVTKFKDFKSIIGSEFTEDILFKGIIDKCFRNSHSTLSYFNPDDIFNPDCYYREGNNIFIIEFKDYLLSSEIIQSNSYEKIKGAIDSKFVGNATNGKRGKGVNQLAWNIEYLINNPDLFYQIDKHAEQEKLSLTDMTISPIIVQTNIYFSFPYINEYLNSIITQRLDSIRGKSKSILPFTMINFGYFFDRVLLFEDGKLNLFQELAFYHKTIEKLKNRSMDTRDENDWINSIAPFSHFNSPEFREHFYYRRKELLTEIEKCWKIDTSKEF